MASPPSDPSPDPVAPAENLRRLEARIARIEAYLRLNEPARAAAPSQPTPAKPDEDLEFRIGQEWFAKGGIAALGVGVAFTLCLPYAALPPAAPSLVGMRWRPASLRWRASAPAPLSPVRPPCAPRRWPSSISQASGSASSGTATP